MGDSAESGGNRDYIYVGAKWTLQLKVELSFGGRHFHCETTFMLSIISLNKQQNFMHGTRIFELHDRKPITINYQRLTQPVFIITYNRRTLRLRIYPPPPPPSPLFLKLHCPSSSPPPPPPASRPTPLPHSIHFQACSGAAF